MSNPVNWKDDYFSKTFCLPTITERFILDRPLQPSGKGKRAGIWSFMTRANVPLYTPYEKVHSPPFGLNRPQVKANGHRSANILKVSEDFPNHTQG